MSTLRQQAIQAVATTKHKLNRVDFKSKHLKDVFGVNTFNESVQRQMLPKPVYKSLQKTIKHGAPLDPAIADSVAVAMKDWAMETRRHPLHPPVPADDRHHRREARLVPLARPTTAWPSPSSAARS